MKASLFLESSSVANVNNNLSSKRANIISGGKRGLAETAEMVFQSAQAVIPRGTGALASSGKITYESTSNTATATISYGDNTINPKTGKATSTYAVARHESPHGGKWLENAILGGGELFVSNVATKISNSF